jgi:hypothetical protein
MSRVSFAKPGAPTVEVDQAVPEQETTQAPETSAEVARPQSFLYNEEEIAFGDIKFPKLHITQKVGQLSNIFKGGEVILNLQLPIYTPPVLNEGVIVKPGTEPLYVVCVGFRKDRYAEQVPQDSEAQGLLCSSLQEVAAVHGTLNYQEHRSRKAANLPSREFKTLATALFLVRKPKDVQDPDRILFPFLCEDEQYVLATFDMKGGAFTNGAQVIRQAKKIGHLNAGGYPSFSWSLATKFKTWQTGNGSFIPVLTPGTKTSEALRAFIKTITGS